MLRMVREAIILFLYTLSNISLSTYGHRSQKTEDPVRSPVLKLRTGGLVLRWVTTWEYPLLYVLLFAMSPAVTGDKTVFCSGTDG